MRADALELLVAWHFTHQAAARAGADVDTLIRVDAHAAFHAEMEKVVRQINLGEYETAEAMLANGTPCAKAFVAMVSAVRQLKKDAKL